MQNLLDAKLNGEKIVFEKLVKIEKNIILAHSKNSSEKITEEINDEFDRIKDVQKYVSAQH